jgi:hypothetical protein
MQCTYNSDVMILKFKTFYKASWCYKRRVRSHAVIAECWIPFTFRFFHSLSIAVYIHEFKTRYFKVCNSVNPIIYFTDCAILVQLLIIPLKYLENEDTTSTNYTLMDVMPFSYSFQFLSMDPEPKLWHSSVGILRQYVRLQGWNYCFVLL